MQSKQIEILMAAYNSAPYIREQVDSILHQTDENWHLTLSDDGSTDGTDAILNEYSSRYPDKVKRVCSGMRFGGARDGIDSFLCFAERYVYERNWKIGS